MFGPEEAPEDIFGAGKSAPPGHMERQERRELDILEGRGFWGVHEKEAEGLGPKDLGPGIVGGPVEKPGKPPEKFQEKPLEAPRTPSAEGARAPKLPEEVPFDLEDFEANPFRSESFETEAPLWTEPVEAGKGWGLEEAVKKPERILAEKA